MQHQRTARGLRALTDAALAEMYEGGDDAARTAVLAEMDRRDQQGAKVPAGSTRRQAEAAEWREAAYAQYLAAEAQCRGNLLSRRGEAEGIAEPFVLWAGQARWAEARASEELHNFWLEHPRMTVTEYRRQVRDARRAARDLDDLAQITTTTPQPAPEPAPVPAPVPAAAPTAPRVPITDLRAYLAERAGRRAATFASLAQRARQLAN